MSKSESPLPDNWHNFPVARLGIHQSSVEALSVEGIRTLGDLSSYIEERGSLIAITGIKLKRSDEIGDKMASFLTANRVAAGAKARSASGLPAVAKAETGTKSVHARTAPRTKTPELRIYELAKELKLDSKKLVDICTRAGIAGKGSVLSSLTAAEELHLRVFLKAREKRS